MGGVNAGRLAPRLGPGAREVAALPVEARFIAAEVHAYTLTLTLLIPIPNPNLINPNSNPNPNPNPNPIPNQVHAYTPSGELRISVHWQPFDASRGVLLCASHTCLRALDMEARAGPRRCRSAHLPPEVRLGLGLGL